MVPTQDEQSFDERYRLWAGAVRRAVRRRQPVIPGGAGSSARTVEVRLEALPAVHRRRHRVAARRRGRQRVRRLPARPRPDDPGPPAPGRHRGGDQGDHRARAPASALPYELEIEAAAQGGRRRARRRAWSASPTRAARRSAPPSGSPARYTGRRLIIRFEGHYHGWQDTVYWSNHVDPAAGRARPSSRVRSRSGPGVPLELADTLIVLDLERPRELRAGHGRARRRGRRGHHRARGLQHRVHPARARLPGTAARARPGGTARC